MMVAAVDQGDLNRRALETIGRLQPAEAGANDHDTMRILRCQCHGAPTPVSCISSLIMYAFARSLQAEFSYGPIAEPYRYHAPFGVGATTMRSRFGSQLPAIAP